MSAVPYEDKELAERCVKFSQEERTAAYAFIIVRKGGEAELKPLRDLADQSLEAEHVTLVFADPSTQGTFPGWPLRNLLAGLAFEKYPFYFNSHCEETKYNMSNLQAKE